MVKNPIYRIIKTNEKLEKILDVMGFINPRTEQLRKKGKHSFSSITKMLWENFYHDFEERKRLGIEETNDMLNFYEINLMRGKVEQELERIKAIQQQLKEKTKK